MTTTRYTLETNRARKKEHPSSRPPSIQHQRLTHKPKSSLFSTTPLVIPFLAPKHFADMTRSGHNSILRPLRLLPHPYTSSLLPPPTCPSIHPSAKYHATKASVPQRSHANLAKSFPFASIINLKPRTPQQLCNHHTHPPSLNYPFPTLHYKTYPLPPYLPHTPMKEKIQGYRSRGCVCV